MWHDRNGARFSHGQERDTKQKQFLCKDNNKIYPNPSHGIDHLLASKRNQKNASMCCGGPQGFL